MNTPNVRGGWSLLTKSHHMNEVVFISFSDTCIIMLEKNSIQYIIDIIFVWDIGVGGGGGQFDHFPKRTVGKTVLEHSHITRPCNIEARNILYESIELFVEDQAFLPSNDWLLPPSPPLPSASCLSFLVFLCVASRFYWWESGGGAKSYDIEISWSSIYHSILSNTVWRELVNPILEWQ